MGVFGLAGVLGLAGWPAAVLAAPLPVDVWALANGGRPLVLQDGLDDYDLPFDVGGARLGMRITIDIDLTDLPRAVRVGRPSFADVTPPPTCVTRGLRVVCELSAGTQSLRGGLRVSVPMDAEPRVGSYRLTVTGDRIDPEPGNNTVTVPVQVRRAPRADLEFAATPATAAVGERLDVRVRVVNHGPDDATGWRPSVTAPTGTEYLGCAGPAGGCGAGFGLRAGASATLSLSFRLTGPRVGTGAWRFDPVRRDPDLANNALPALGSLIRVLTPSDGSPAGSPGVPPTGGPPTTGAPTGPPTGVPTGPSTGPPTGPPDRAPGDPVPTPSVTPTPTPTSRPPTTSPPGPRLSAVPLTPMVGVSGTGAPPSATTTAVAPAPPAPGVGGAPVGAGGSLAEPPQPAPVGARPGAWGHPMDITRQALVVLAMVVALPVAVLSGLAARRRYLARWRGRHSG